MIGKLKKFYRMNITPHCKGKFSDYEEARKSVGKGYEDGDLIDRVVNNTYKGSKESENFKTFDFTDLRFCIPALVGGYRKQEEIRITDLGGASGWGYFLADAILGRDNKIFWNVVETKALSQKANKLFCNQNLKFTDFDSYMEKLEKDSMDGIEVLLMSSTLQYLEYPEDILYKIVKSKKYEKIWITRTPFLEEGNSIISIQESKLSNNGIKSKGEILKEKIVKYPITFIVLEKVIKLLQENGYKTCVFKENTYMTARKICANYYSVLAVKNE